MAKIKTHIEEEQQEENEALDFQRLEWLETTKRKSLIRIPCEQYAFIEMEVEENPRDTIEMYRYLANLYQGGIGISEKDFNEYLDNYLSKENPIGSEIYAVMNSEQQKIIQTIKRAIKRIKQKSE